MLTLQIKDDDIMVNIEEAIQKTADDLSPNSGYCTKEELRKIIKKRLVPASLFTPFSRSFIIYRSFCFVRILTPNYAVASLKINPYNCLIPVIDMKHNVK